MALFCTRLFLIIEGMMVVGGLHVSPHCLGYILCIINEIASGLNVSSETGGQNRFVLRNRRTSPPI